VTRFADSHLGMLAAIAAAVSILLYPAGLSAREYIVEVEVHYMPPGKLVRLPDGLRLMCFDIDEYKTLLEMDNHLYTVNRQFKLLTDAEINYQNILVEKEAIIGTLESDKEILATRGLRLEEKWQTCEEDLVDAQSGSVWPYVLAAAGAAIGVAGVVWGVTIQVASAR